MKSDDIVQDGWITANQVAEMLGVGQAYVHRLVDIGLLPEGRRVGGAQRVTFFRQEVVEAYMKTHPNVGKRRAEKLANA